MSSSVISVFFLAIHFGVYYLIIGLGIFLMSIYVACSKYGNIVLGSPDEKPKFSFFAWGSMMFTAGLAADILFYSFSEWILYASDPHIAELGSIQDWASTYPLFHWSLIPWGFYLVLAVAFGFMLHVRKRDIARNTPKPAARSSANTPTDLLGRLIDLLAVFALLSRYCHYIQSGYSSDGKRDRRALPRLAVNRTVVTIIILVTHLYRIHLFPYYMALKGISMLANILHLPILWSSGICPALWR